MRHKKTFDEGVEFEEVVLWVQGIIQMREKIIPGLHDLDHPDTTVVLADTYTVSIMKNDNIKQLTDGE